MNESLSISIGTRDRLVGTRDRLVFIRVFIRDRLGWEVGRLLQPIEGVRVSEVDGFMRRVFPQGIFLSRVTT